MNLTIDRRSLLPALVMLLALAGLSLSVIGEAFSHGVVELAGDTESELSNQANFHHGHGHSHGYDTEPESSLHHDASNHTHETVDQLTIPLVNQRFNTYRQPLPFAGGSPRSVRYRLERPPKDSYLA